MFKELDWTTSPGMKELLVLCDSGRSFAQARQVRDLSSQHLGFRLTFRTLIFEISINN